MFIVDLRCGGGHAFEGWYDSSNEYASIRDAGELTCPLCGRDDVERELSTGAIQTTKTQDRNARQTARAMAGPDAPAMPLEMQKQLAKFVQHVRATHEDVGDQFADKARAIHRGEAPAAPIRGQATADEEAELAEEGVPFLKVPVPDIEVN